MDRKAEKYCFQSPYAYVNNNPLVYFDPNGNEGILVYMFDARMTGGKRTAGVATGFMFDFNAGQAAVFFSPSVGIGGGGGVIWSLNIGYYPNATIEKLREWCINVGAAFSGDLPGFPSWLTRSLEFNFPINPKDFSEINNLIQEAIKNGGANTSLIGGALENMAAMVYLDIGYTFMKMGDFKNLSPENLKEFLNTYMLIGKFSDEEALQMLQLLYELYYNLEDLTKEISNENLKNSNFKNMETQKSDGSGYNNNQNNDKEGIFIIWDFMQSSAYKY